MLHPVPHAGRPLPPAAPLPVTAWTLRAWPPLLWQADQAGALPLRHVGTRVTSADAGPGAAGQTLWVGPSVDGEAGVAWDWVQIAQGIVALADPMSVVTNLRLLGGDGEVLTAAESALYLNALVHALPWQGEVARALRGPTQ